MRYLFMSKFLAQSHFLNTFLYTKVPLVLILQRYQDVVTFIFVTAALIRAFIKSKVLILGIYTPLLYNNLLIAIFIELLVCWHKKLIVKLVARTSLWIGAAIFAITLALLLPPLYVILNPLILNEVFLNVAPFFAKERSAIDAFCVFWTFVFPIDV